jgi:hypothetical protein
MRYLRVVILLSIFSFGMNATVFAQICCPAGCVQDANRCVTTGPNPRTCNTVPGPVYWKSAGPRRRDRRRRAGSHIPWSKLLSS